MPMGGDEAAKALTALCESAAPTWRGGWARRVPGALGVATMVPVATLNWVLAEEVDPDYDFVASLLDHLRGMGVPHSLQLRERTPAAFDDLAHRRQMKRGQDIPMMVLADTEELTAPAASGLAIRELAPEEVAEHAAVAAIGFETPEEYFRDLVTPEFARLPGMHIYLGEVGGEPVTTGVGIRRDDSVGVLNIATLPAHRGRGYGAAITARVVRDAFADGARWTWLQASPAGFPVYLEMGFHTVETWRCWLET